MSKKRKHYPSEISREHFNVILPILESAKKKTVPREVELYDVFNAILYLLARRLSLAQSAWEIS